jgi:hypothetical protein
VLGTTFANPPAARSSPQALHGSLFAQRLDAAYLQLSPVKSIIADEQRQIQEIVSRRF